tara:strand:+ start:440 stop:712 length:273 start_codon:yes stop_codon:yes gene_type:complete
MSRFLQIYSETGIEKTPIKYNKTGCGLYVPEICEELNGLSDARGKLKIINDELVAALELMLTPYSAGTPLLTRNELQGAKAALSKARGES